MNIEQQYLDLLQDVLSNGEDRLDRTGIGVRSLFGKQLRCELNAGFPALTTKKLAWKAIVAELLWFIEGSQDERRLAELTYGSQELNKTTIWSGNAYADYWKDKATFTGDVGRIYGVQWRRWKHTTIPDYSYSTVDNNETVYYGAVARSIEIDQLARIIKTIKSDPTNRRMVLTAFNVGELDQMSLPPCHMFCQFYVSTAKRSLSCQVYIRSNDLALGLPFNLASYALLTHMIAQVTSTLPGELIITIGDAHIYRNHIDGVKEQLSRTPKNLPTLVLNPDVVDIDKFKLDDIKLLDYESHPAISLQMAV